MLINPNAKGTKKNIKIVIFFASGAPHSEIISNISLSAIFVYGYKIISKPYGFTNIAIMVVSITPTNVHNFFLGNLTKLTFPNSKLIAPAIQKNKHNKYDKLDDPPCIFIHIIPNNGIKYTSLLFLLFV